METTANSIGCRDQDIVIQLVEKRGGLHQSATSFFYAINNVFSLLPINFMNHQASLFTIIAFLPSLHLCMGIDVFEAGGYSTCDTQTIGTGKQVMSMQVMPSATVEFDIHYHYTLNKGSHIHTGEIKPGADLIAYFFPRIAVYDDIDRWNNQPYLCLQDFYNDFCHFEVNITVPKHVVVWCTGNLLNGQEVLTDSIWHRLQSAAHSDELVIIIHQHDISQHNIMKDTPQLHWKFVAGNDVSDVASATSDHYIWQSTILVVDSSSGSRTRVDAVFNPDHKDYFAVADYAIQTVRDMSFRYPNWPFLYAHETVFDGLDKIEYPMMVNDNPEDTAAAIELTGYEIFHTLFPFYMGINETKYAWMDEGWATLGEWLLSPMIDSSITDDYGVAAYEHAAGTEDELPNAVPSTQLTCDAYFLDLYPKPALGYLYVKDRLGDKCLPKHCIITSFNGRDNTCCHLIFSKV